MLADLCNCDLGGATHRIGCRALSIEVRPDALEIRRAEQRGRDAILRELKDPERVHVAMLRGDIGIPSIRAMLHLHGQDAIRKWDETEALAARSPQPRTGAE